MTMQLRDPKIQPSTSQTGDQYTEGMKQASSADWLKRARDAYRYSTNYVDSNYRKGWEDSIRAFHSEHPNDSKYNQAAYEKRSRIYRPKTRMVIRKNEAAAAAAFFSNMDVVDVSPIDANSADQAASAAIMKEILQFRLTKTIPWFQTVMGGLQDAQTAGVTVAHIYWEYRAVTNDNPQNEEQEGIEAGGGDSEYQEQHKLPDGAFSVTDQGMIKESRPLGHRETTDEAPNKQPKPLEDQPVIDLIPIENIRISPDSSWIDPINSSPFVIHLMPMYLMDIKGKMETGEWKTLSDDIIKQGQSGPDTTRAARQKGLDDPMDGGGGDISDYDVIWVQRHIHRQNNDEVEFYTLSDVAMLTDPLPLKQVVFHGKRPYVMGFCLLESHRLYPSSIPQLGKGLQDEANEVANQRLDNVKFVLNKKWFVKRGRDADLAGLVRNVPGGVVMLEDPQTDVKEVTWPDVTQSAYEEQNRIDRDLDELLGSFSPAQLMADGQLNAPARNMSLLANSAGTMTEYLLKTFVETFVQPVLRQLVLLEQHYETDEVVLGIAAKKANLFQKFGISDISDKMLEQELTLNVNVGMGATDPGQKLNRFITGVTAFGNIVKMQIPGLNLQESGKEIFGHMGYSDGARFFGNQDPQLAAMQQQIQQAQQMIQHLQGQLKDKMTIAHENNQTKLTIAQMHEGEENKRALATHVRAISEAQGKGGDKGIPADQQAALKKHEIDSKTHVAREKNHMEFAAKMMEKQSLDAVVVAEGQPKPVR